MSLLDCQQFHKTFDIDEVLTTFQVEVFLVHSIRPDVERTVPTATMEHSLLYHARKYEHFLILFLLALLLLVLDSLLLTNRIFGFLSERLSSYVPAVVTNSAVRMPRSGFASIDDPHSEADLVSRSVSVSAISGKNMLCSPLSTCCSITLLILANFEQHL